jgi:hypothetical protein
MTTVCCFKCHATFCITKDAKRELKETHEIFWCPYCGKSQYFPHKSENEELKEVLERYRKKLVGERARHDQTKADRDYEKRRRASMQGVVTRTKKRIGKGICPCCNRYFKNLHRHMTNQHPEYK